MTLFDTNVVLDLFGDDIGDHVRWSHRQYGEAARRGDLQCSTVVVAELAGLAEEPRALLALLDRFEIGVSDLPVEAAFAAGRAFRAYRRRGGPRETILADFLIAGHATSLGAILVTRDRRLASYFPDLTFITPETHPHG